jgi:SAM-dependent methyltransferase
MSPTSSALSDRIWGILACPACGGALEPAGTAARCSRCGTGFSRDENGQLDLRLRDVKTAPIEIRVPGSSSPALDAGRSFERLAPKANPEVDLSQLKGPCHLPHDLRSHIPRAPRSGSFALDLGCGAQVHQEVCTLAGYEYVGLDYGTPEAMLLGDAQALPFADGVFSFTISIAVIEHVPYPLLLMREAFRTLAPGGIFLGTVAFLEPFHQRSLYHHTHLGLLNDLAFAGFQVDHVAPVSGWPGLVAQAHMGWFPNSPRWLARALTFPLLALQRAWWAAGHLVDREATDDRRRLKNAGALLFVARRPAAGTSSG